MQTYKKRHNGEEGQLRSEFKCVALLIDLWGIQMTGSQDAQLWMSYKVIEVSQLRLIACTKQK